MIFVFLQRFDNCQSNRCSSSYLTIVEFKGNRKFCPCIKSKKLQYKLYIPHPEDFNPWITNLTVFASFLFLLKELAMSDCLEPVIVLPIMASNRNVTGTIAALLWSGTLLQSLNEMELNEIKVIE